MIGDTYLSYNLTKEAKNKARGWIRGVFSLNGAEQGL